MYIIQRNFRFVHVIFITNQAGLEKNPAAIESVAFSFSVNCSFNNFDICQRQFHLKIILLRSSFVSFKTLFNNVFLILKKWSVEFHFNFLMFPFLR